MFGFVAGGSPPPERWGSSSVEADWSGTVTKSGIYEFKKLTIADDTLVKVGSTGVMRNGIVIFASQEIIIGDNVEFLAQPNSDNYLEATTWRSSGADTTRIGYNGGGGGGGFGCNGTGGAGFAGNDPVVYLTKNQGTEWGDVLDELTLLTVAEGGAGGRNRSGYPGQTGGSFTNQFLIKDNYTFTKGENPYHPTHDDFPVLAGGDGGGGGDTCGSTDYNDGGSGGTGGGMIQLIAPKITFGTNTKLNAYGNAFNAGTTTTNDGVYNNYSLRNSYKLRNLNGTSHGDGGSGGGGAGGGGFVSIIYWQKVGDYTANVSGGYGGDGKTGDGNIGGDGGAGGAGIALEGQRNLLSGEIEWVE